MGKWCIYQNRQFLSLIFGQLLGKAVEVYYQIFSYSILNSELETGKYMWHISGESHQ